MLSDIDWNCIYSSKHDAIHVDEAWQYFTTHFCSILNLNRELYSSKRSES